MSLTIASCAPLRINTTVVPIDNLQVSPDIQAVAYRHSGNEFPSALIVPGANPRARFSMPAKTAYDLIGLKGLLATVFDVYQAKFVSSLRSTGTDHFKYSLASSALALVWISRITCRERAIAMADVEAVLLSSNGTTYPLAAPSTGSLPTLASQPELHTLGSTLVNGSAIPGAGGVDIDLGANIVVGIDGSPGDGLLYPTVAQYLGGTPVITVEHGDPVGVLAALGYTGAALSSNFVQWFRQYDAVNQLTLTTGFSITAALGRASPADISSPNQAVSKGGIRVEALSASSTHPLVVGTGSVP